MLKGRQSCALVLHTFTAGLICSCCAVASSSFTCLFFPALGWRYVLTSCGWGHPEFTLRVFTSGCGCSGFSVGFIFAAPLARPPRQFPMCFSLACCLCASVLRWCALLLSSLQGFVCLSPACPTLGGSPFCFGVGKSPHAFKGSFSSLLLVCLGAFVSASCMQRTRPSFFPVLGPATFTALL